MSLEKNKPKPPIPKEAQNIVDVLIKKNKKSFSNKVDSLGRLAANITPSYRSFIHKIINNCSLKIVAGSHSFLTSYEEDTEQNGLEKRQKNYLSFDVDNLGAFAHELGHSVDFLFGRSQPLSRKIVLSSGGTLCEVFEKEFESVHENVFKEVMEIYKSLLNSKINKTAFDIIINNLERFRDLRNKGFLPEAQEFRKKLQTELYKSGFVETFYELYTNDYPKTINEGYSTVIDALSSKYDLSYLGLCHHEIEYYRSDPGTKQVQEFFANLFSAKVTSNQAQLDNTAKYFPRSFEAFEELFSIIFNHIEQNKRFTDVKIRKGEKHD